MNFVKVSRQIPALREGHRADGALEGMDFGVLTEVVLKVVAPLEHLVAALNSASEIKLLSFFAFAGNFDGLVPGPGDIGEGLGQEVEDLAPRALTRV